MKPSLRLRFFFWLLLLLVIFMIVQTMVYGLVEMLTIARNPELSVREQLEEVVMGVGLDILTLPLLAVAAWWISSRMIRPIRTLATTANLIGAGQLEKRVNVESMPDDEMRTLAHVLNQAFDRYRHAMDNIERFTGDASHQLRTPLASMRLTAEVALSGGARDAEPYRDALGSILEDLAKLSHLVDQLLAMARLGAEGLQSSFEKVDAAQLLRAAAEVYRPACDLLGVVLEVDSGPDCFVYGSRELLMEALRNLIDNAIKFAGSSGPIRLTAARAGGAVEIRVMDKGSGIDPKHAEAVFERFYRVPSSNRDGAGLGLALVRDIAGLHEGSVGLVSLPGWGAVFQITLPAC